MTRIPYRSAVVVAIVLTVISAVSISQGAKKFSTTSQAKFLKACGDGLDEHSACGSCGYLQGVAFTKGTVCGHVCVKLPDGKTDQDMTLTALGADDSVTPNFRPCGSPNTAGACDIGYARFESNEWYPQTHQLCGRFKNWSNTTERLFKIVVTEK